MGVILFIVIFFPLSLWLSILAAAKGDQVFLIRKMTMAWVLFMPMLLAVNMWIPFSLGGDDSNYYQIAEQPFKSFEEVFDLTRFMGQMEQPGYPWLLSLLNAITGHNLFVFKALNFFFLLMLALTWYRIGLVLEGHVFARKIFILILVFTPLWYYVFILLKDMVITLLQSLFLLAAINIWVRLAFRPFFLAALFCLFLIFFRTALLMQNLVVFLGGTSVKILGSRVGSNRVAPLLISLFLGAVLLFIFSNPETMYLFGIYTEHRVIGSSTFMESSDLYSGFSSMNRNLFPFLYLFSETTGFSPLAWARMDSTWLRGVLVIPWIIFGVPFFIIGLFALLKPSNGERFGRAIITNIRASRAVSTPWGLVLIFVATSVAISWVVGDSTRWRIPDFPMLAAIALAGWMQTRNSVSRQMILLTWLLVITVAFGLFFGMSS